MFSAGLTKYLVAALAFLAVTALTLIATLMWRLEAVSNERAQYKAQAAASLAVIDRLEASVALNEDILVEVRAARNEVRAQARQTERAISELEATNEAVRNYLDQPLPPDLAAVLWPDADTADADTPGAPE